VLQWLRGWFGSSAPAVRSNPIRGRYDNAITTDDNKRNWWGGDVLSAKAANSFMVRRTLRTRSRYEVSNNPFLYGICSSNADDLIGRGPTLQVMTPDAGYNRDYEATWNDWAAEVELTEKLRTLKLARSVDGEGFLVLKTVNSLDHPVKLYPCDVEADQVTTPSPANYQDFWVDGLTLHPVTGRPVSFDILKSHPGDLFFPNFNPMAFDRVNARYVIHWFEKFRPGQVRGVPVFTPSLDMFAELRAFRKAVLGAAQTAANFTVMLEQQAGVGAPADTDDDNVEYKPFSKVPVERNMIAMMPPGTTAKGFDAKQPSTTYEMFQEKCLGEACRPLKYPLLLALGTSQKANFSSARLDITNYRSGLNVERNDCEVQALNRTHRAWHEEAVLSGAVRPFDGIKPPPCEWHWPGFEPLDPVVDATADHDRLAAGTLTFQQFWASRGYDWRDVMAQQAAEQQEIERLGLEFGEPTKRSVTETLADPEAALVP